MGAIMLESASLLLAVFWNCGSSVTMSSADEVPGSWNSLSPPPHRCLRNKITATLPCVFVSKWAGRLERFSKESLMWRGWKRCFTRVLVSSLPSGTARSIYDSLVFTFHRLNFIGVLLICFRWPCVFNVQLLCVHSFLHRLDIALNCCAELSYIHASHKVNSGNKYRIESLDMSSPMLASLQNQHSLIEKI